MTKSNVRGRLRRILFVAIALLYVISVPWYRADDAPLRIVLGMPDWVAVAVCCYALIAVLNSLAWLLRDTRPEHADTATGEGP